MARNSPDGEQLVYLMRLPEGPPVVLHGTAALIWLAAAQEGEPHAAAGVCEAVAGRLGLAPQDITSDVVAYLEVLFFEGLLDQSDTSDEGPRRSALEP